MGGKRGRVKEGRTYPMTKDGKGWIWRGLIPDGLERLFHRSMMPVIGFFSSARIDPNGITIGGCLLSVASAFFVAREKFVTGGVLIAIAGMCDFLDGKVAARTQRASEFGGILDTVLDRYSDFAIYLGIILYYLKNGFAFSAIVAVLALAGTFMTSYIKAVGDSHGIKLRMGVMRRQERITLIFIGLVFAFLDPGIADSLRSAAAYFHGELGRIPVMPLTLVVYLLAVLTNVSALQRFLLLRKKTKAAGRPPANKS
jgi:CDP-diacylglycerol---glycerol-3-phosphate 3-phosphatidyltransferase